MLSLSSTDSPGKKGLSVAARSTAAKAEELSGSDEIEGWGELARQPVRKSPDRRQIGIW
jgi:hypothetical protein